jgi:alcohol dehydrogenase class IV
VKYPLADFNITPDVAIVDPDLAETMPKKLTANTGMDAMTHAIEAYVSTLHCDYTDPLAIHAIRMIGEFLIPSYNGDMEARDRMHNAQCLAGMAFSNALLGIVHSMAHKTGAAFSGGHIVHGAANAMYLPKVIQYNAKNPEAAKRYGEIALCLGLEPTADALIRHIRKMNEALSIAPCIKAYEGGIIDEKEFLEKLPKVAELAVGDACTGSNPRAITRRRWKSFSKPASMIRRSTSSRSRTMIPLSRSRSRLPLLGSGFEHERANSKAGNGKRLRSTANGQRIPEAQTFRL